MKKILALLLAVMMVAALFVGCANTQTEPDETGDSQASAGDTKLPYEGVVVTITRPVDEDVDDLWVYDVIEEKFGCDIQVIEIASDIYTDKMAAMLAENNLPTVFQGFTSVSQIVEYGEQGAFVDVMDPENLAKMPNFAAIFAEDEEVNSDYMKTAAEDGSHYILPVYDIERSVNHYWIYNETAFKEAGVEWSGDVANGGFLQMLRDLKAYYPNSYPLTGGAWASTIARMGYSFNVNSNDAAYDYDTDTWYFGSCSEGYYQVLDLLRTCYNEKLMNPDMLTQGNGAIQDDIMNHESFLYNSWLGWMTMHNAAFVDGGVDDHEIPAPSSVGINGKTLELKTFSNSGGVVINAKNPEAAECAMAILDWCYDMTDKTGGAWVNTVGPDDALTTDENGRLNWIDESYPNGVNNDMNYAAEKYGLFHNVLCVRYHPDSPYYTFNEEEQMAQEIGDKIGYYPATPAMAVSDVEIADAYTASKKDAQAMFQAFIVENWSRADWEAWRADFLDEYGAVIDYINENF